MLLAYVAGPYRAATPEQVRANVEAAKQVASTLWAQGIAAICPHANTEFMDGQLPDRTFLDGDMEMLCRCDLLVLVTPHYECSAGTRMEVALAGEEGIPVFGVEGAIAYACRVEAREAQQRHAAGCKP